MRNSEISTSISKDFARDFERIYIYNIGIIRLLGKYFLNIGYLRGISKEYEDP